MSKNKFFQDAERPLSALAAMLVHLDDAGLIPTDMREAIRSHAANSLDTLPSTMAATARALAAAAQSEDAPNGMDVSNVSYGMASMAEQMQGFASLAEHFKVEQAEVRNLRKA